VRTPTEPGLVPFITQRAGEEAAPDNLTIVPYASGPLLRYRDEDPKDRPLRGVLWARCAFNPPDEKGMPTGEPRWKNIHPYRQMLTMQHLHCQICTQPARTALGYPFFLPRGHTPTPAPAVIRTNQPPVCAKHLRAAATLCPHVEPVVHLARGAPLYGVHGTLYGLNKNNQVHVIAQPDDALPFAHPNLPTFLASQLIRRLSHFTLIGLDELLHHLKHTP
jgi:hypothetical protein